MCDLTILFEQCNITQIFTEIESDIDSSSLTI